MSWPQEKDRDPEDCGGQGGCGRCESCDNHRINWNDLIITVVENMWEKSYCEDIEMLLDKKCFKLYGEHYEEAKESM